MILGDTFHTTQQFWVPTVIQLVTLSIWWQFLIWKHCNASYRITRTYLMIATYLSMFVYITNIIIVTDNFPQYTDIFLWGVMFCEMDATSRLTLIMSRYLLHNETATNFCDEMFMNTSWTWNGTLHVVHWYLWNFHYLLSNSARTWNCTVHNYNWKHMLYYLKWHCQLGLLKPSNSTVLFYQVCCNMWSVFISPV